MKFITLLFTAILLSSCAAQNHGKLIVGAGTQPSEAQASEAIINTLQGRLKDPGSLQQFKIQSMTLFDIPRGLVNGGGYDQVWAVAFVYNAKNSFGGYVGLKKDCLAVRMSDGQITVADSLLISLKCKEL